MFKDWLNSFKFGHYEAQRDLWALWNFAPGPLIGLFAVSFVLSQGFEVLKPVSDTGEPNVPVLIFMVLGDLALYFLVLLWLPRRCVEGRSGRPLTPLFRIAAESGRDLLAELLRMAAQVIIGIIFLVVPGLLLMARYAFVPFIVTTDSDYRQGLVDALERSKELSRGLAPVLLALWVAFTTVDFWLYRQQNRLLMEDMTSLQEWALQGLISLISYFTLLYSTLLNFALYKMRHNAKGANS